VTKEICFVDRFEVAFFGRVEPERIASPFPLAVFFLAPFGEGAPSAVAITEIAAADGKPVAILAIGAASGACSPI